MTLINSNISLLTRSVLLIWFCYLNIENLISHMILYNYFYLLFLSFSYIHILKIYLKIKKTVFFSFKIIFKTVLDFGNSAKKKRTNMSGRKVPLVEYPNQGIKSCKVLNFVVFLFYFFFCRIRFLLKKLFYFLPLTNMIIKFNDSFLDLSIFFCRY